MSSKKNDLYFYDNKYVNMDDVALVSSARLGDSAALNCLFDRYNLWLFE